MSKSLDLRKIKKPIFKVTFDDATLPELSVLPPTKQIVDAISDVQQSYNSLVGENDNVDQKKAEEVMDTMYELLAKALSNNSNNIHISKEYLKNSFDIEDMKAVMGVYTEYILEIIQLKN